MASSDTLQQLIIESGRTPDPRIDEFTRLASAVQRMRHEENVSDTSGITRSTGLWTLMQLDPYIRIALQGGGVDQEQLGKVLSISRIPRSVGADVANLHEDFAWAMRTYLTSLSDKHKVVLLADVASAIIRSGRDDPRGLLPQRLGNLTINYDVVMLALNVAISETLQDNTPSANPPEFSESMRSVADELSATSVDVITALYIARAISRRHPEYASGQLGTATIDAPTAAGRAWPEWRDSVAELYDRDVVAKTRHELLDGRLFLIGLGYLDPTLRTALEEAGVWGPLVLEVDEAVAPEGSMLRLILQEVQFAYGYQSDEAGGPDQLGVQGEVNALCEVLIDPDVKPPLAVGLFGEWGTGKSFFMEKMRERVHARKQSNIVQIRFNAWHYADTSLWASLAIEIFERLADPEPVLLAERDQWLCDHGDVSRSEREKLLTQLETYREAKAALDAEQTQLETARNDAVQRRDAARQRQHKAIKDAPLTDVAGELARDPKVREALAGIAKRLGFSPAVEELTGLGAELRTTAGYLPSVWRLVRHKSWAVTLTAACVVLTLATAALIVHGGWAWLGSVATAVGSVGAAVVAAARLVRPAARKVNQAIADVESAINTASEIEARLRSKRSREERALELTLAEFDREIAEASQAIAALDEKIATTKAAAEALTVGRKLYEFLTDRAAGYQKHQGVVGMLHRDFRFLDAQLRAYRASADAEARLPRIDRVILYIDDLDRCPPAKVLEVLEAVHLLLALKLFVVVVGVDPRWLQRSLRHQYRDLVTGDDPRTDPYLRAMPVEYLEKIFQIPLTLPVMEPTAYARLIASLAPTMATSKPPPVPASTTTHRAQTRESPGGDRTPTRAPLEVQPGSSASGEPGRRIDLTRTEIEFAQQLGALVDSPRAAKRLINTYRLIRATQHVGSRSRFLGGAGQPGEYQAVLTLLAVAAGFPTIADRLLVALESDAPETNIQHWSDFVRELSPKTSGNQPGKLMPADLAGSSDDTVRNELATWTNLCVGLAASLEFNDLKDLEPYRRWGRIVARFSFTL
jgi:hypothetical protein